MDSKKWWASKSIWVGVIALVATVVQAKCGFVVSPEYQGYLLSIAMIALRIITKAPIE